MRQSAPPPNISSLLPRTEYKGGVNAVAADRFFLRRHRVVNAGAGTGKTYALITQYLHLVSGITIFGQPLEPRAICALTFTEKAAGEMRERLGRRLLDIVRVLADVGDTPAAYAEPLVQLEPELCASARALSRGLPALRHFESVRAELSAAPIGTFHSFAAALLRRHAVASEIDPDFSLLDEDAARELLEECSERVVLGAIEERYGQELAMTTAQLLAEYGFRGGARAEGGLVEALCRLYRARAEEGRGAAELGAAYTQPVLEAERLRLARELGAGLRALLELSNVLTGKSAERAVALGQQAAELSHKLLGTGRDEAGLPNGLGEALPFLALLPKELGRLRAPKGKNGDGTDTCGTELRALVADLKRAASEAQALYESHRAAPLSRGIEALLAVLMDVYAEHKRAAAVLDFSDLLGRARDLLRDSAAVQKSEQARYAALLVDEFQDTSPLQAELLRLLIGLSDKNSSPADSAAPRRLYIVGDRKQSIYGFRGADVTAYERLCTELIDQGADEETLAVSRRSQPALLESCNDLFARVFSGGDRAAGFVVWDEARDPLRPHREALPSVEPLVEVLRESAREPKSDPSNLETAAAKSDASAGPDDPLAREAGLVARRIAAFADSGIRYGDIVLLLRRFTHLLRYTTALKQAGIPHYVVRGRGFYQAQEVLDLAAFLTLLDDPEDRLAFLAVLRSPLFGLSDESLLRLHLAGKLSLLSLLSAHDAKEDSAASELTSLPRDEAMQLVRLLGLMRALLHCGDRLGPLACLSTLLDHTDYLGVLYADPDGEQRVANVFRLCERARTHEARGGSLRSFVRALRKDADPRLAELSSERDEPTAPVVSEAEDVVRVMTVHQAKGLEWKAVVVAGCSNLDRVDAPAIAYDRAFGLGLRLFRGGERVETLGSLRVHELGKKRNAAESGRLFYVAATRARDRLVFAGEVRRGRKAPAGTWLSYLDTQASFCPPPSSRLLPPVEGAEDATRLAFSQLPKQAATVYALGDATAAASGFAGAELSLSLDAAADLLVCGRRFHLRHMLHVGEKEPALAPGRGEDPPGAAPLGTLAAEILDGIDLLEFAKERKPEEVLSAHLLSRGHDVRSLAISELITRLLRFLHSRYLGQALAQPAGRLQLLRAAPYAVGLSADAKRVRLHGVLDLAVFTAALDPMLEVLEYRYGYAPDGVSPLDAVRRQLLAVVARQTVFAPGKGLGPAAMENVSIKIGTCYLRESDPQPRFVQEPQGAGARQNLEAALFRAAPTACLGQVAALRLPVLPAQTCEEVRCGYRFLCHGRA